MSGVTYRSNPSHQNSPKDDFSQTREGVGKDKAGGAHSETKASDVVTTVTVTHLHKLLSAENPMRVIPLSANLVRLKHLWIRSPDNLCVMHLAEVYPIARLPVGYIPVICLHCVICLFSYKLNLLPWDIPTSDIAHSHAPPLGKFGSTNCSHA